MAKLLKKTKIIIPDRIIKTKEEYKKLISDVLNSDDPVLGLDTETQEFSEDRSSAFELALEGLGVFNKDVRAYILPNVLDKAFQKVLDKKEIIMHNAKFDLTIIEREGFNTEKTIFHDSMLMAWLANENRMSYKLKDLAELLLIKPKKNKDGEVKKKATRFKDLDKKPELADYPDKKSFQVAMDEWVLRMGTYCIKDCEYTYGLYQYYKPILEKDDLWKVYTQSELPFVRVLKDIEWRGIKINIPYLKKLGKKLDVEIEEAINEVYKEAGGEIDINSPKQLRELLFDKMKLELPAEYKTPKGEVSTNVAAMNYLADTMGVDIAKKILKVRELGKINSTYVKALLAKQKDGIIHAQFRQIGTVTGRLSSSNPNLQNIPRRADELNIRKAFVPRPGYVFVNSDYSQVELRMMAFYSKDPAMLKIYAEDGDIHQATADAVGCTRQQAKSISFGIIYGVSGYGLSKLIDTTPEEADRFIKSYLNNFSRVGIFIKQAINTLQKNYAVRTITKRKRRFPDYAAAKRRGDWKEKGRIERQTVNSIIQGSAADLIKISMRNLARRLKEYDAHILVQIHDELIVEVPKEKAKEVMGIVKYEMENAMDLKVIKIKTEPKITKVWEK